MPDVSDVMSWPQAIVALGLILAVGVVPSVLATLVTAHRTHATTQRVEETTQRVEDTLTTANGGSHVKDALNRIERNVSEARAESHAVLLALQRHERESEARLTALENARRGRLRRFGRWRR